MLQTRPVFNTPERRAHRGKSKLPLLWIGLSSLLFFLILIAVWLFGGDSASDLWKSLKSEVFNEQSK